MSLANFSLPYQLATPSPYVFTENHGPRSTISNLRLNAVLPPPPAPSFDNEHRFQNEPYIPPARYQQQHQQQQQRQREQQLRAQESYAIQQQSSAVASSFSGSSQDTRYANYNQDFRRTQPRQQQILQHQQQQQQQRPPPSIPQQQHQHTRVPSRQDQDNIQSNAQQNDHQNRESRNDGPDNYPGRPGDGYTRVNGGAYGNPGAKTSVHAILDYDDDDEEDEDENPDEYYDDAERDVPKDTRVTPIQGPIFLKNGSVPVVPLYSYPQLNNGTFVQIPILWTALSVALGVELRGDLVRGTPCIKKNHQLFCPTAGKTYPIERIEQFIDENKALMKRMYGDFEMDEDYGSPTREPGARRRRNTKKHDLPDGGPSLRDDERHRRHQTDKKVVEGGESFFSKVRNTRQTFGNNRGNDSGRVDACESKVEIVTPYWASNSAGKIRAIVNTQHFEQAIHQEVCTKTQTNRCTGDCGCEQKYKWHRLLAYDPDNDCKGIFMDWFLFPSCCVCRCDPAHRKFPSTTNRN